MGLAWQQGPLAAGSIGHFLTPEPLPEHLLFVEPLRRRMRVRLADKWLADSEDVLLLHEPGRYPVAYFPLADIGSDVLAPEDRVTTHGELGDIQWYTVSAGDRQAPHAAWQHTALPSHATDLTDRVAFAWRAMEHVVAYVAGIGRAPQKPQQPHHLGARAFCRKGCQCRKRAPRSAAVGLRAVVDLRE